MQSLQTGALDAVPRMKYPHLPHMCNCQINMQAWFLNKDSQGGEIVLEHVTCLGLEGAWINIIPCCHSVGSLGNVFSKIGGNTDEYF